MPTWKVLKAAAKAAEAKRSATGAAPGPRVEEPRGSLKPIDATWAQSTFSGAAEADAKRSEEDLCRAQERTDKEHREATQHGADPLPEEERLVGVPCRQPEQAEAECSQIEHAGPEHSNCEEKENTQAAEVEVAGAEGHRLEEADSTKAEYRREEADSTKAEYRRCEEVQADESEGHRREETKATEAECRRDAEAEAAETEHRCREEAEGAEAFGFGGLIEDSRCEEAEATEAEHLCRKEAAVAEAERRCNGEAVAAETEPSRGEEAEATEAERLCRKEAEVAEAERRCNEEAVAAQTEPCHHEQAEAVKAEAQHQAGAVEAVHLCHAATAFPETEHCQHEEAEAAHAGLRLSEEAMHRRKDAEAAEAECRCHEEAEAAEAERAETDDEPPSPGSLPLVRAVRVCDLDEVCRLLDQGAEPNVPDAAGDTPLIQSVERNCINISAALLLHSADPNWENNMGLVPMDYANPAHETLLRLFQKAEVSEEEVAIMLDSLNGTMRDAVVAWMKHPEETIKRAEDPRSDAMETIKEAEDPRGDATETIKEAEDPRGGATETIKEAEDPRGDATEPATCKAADEGHPLIEGGLQSCGHREALRQSREEASEVLPENAEETTREAEDSRSDAMEPASCKAADEGHPHIEGGSQSCDQREALRQSGQEAPEVLPEYAKDPEDSRWQEAERVVDAMAEQLVDLLSAMRKATGKRKQELLLRLRELENLPHYLAARGFLEGMDASSFSGKEDSMRAGSDAVREVEACIEEEAKSRHKRADDVVQEAEENDAARGRHESEDIMRAGNDAVREAEACREEAKSRHKRTDDLVQEAEENDAARGRHESRCHEWKHRSPERAASEEVGQEDGEDGSRHTPARPAASEEVEQGPAHDCAAEEAMELQVERPDRGTEEPGQGVAPDAESCRAEAGQGAQQCAAKVDTDTVSPSGLLVGTSGSHSRAPAELQDDLAESMWDWTDDGSHVTAVLRLLSDGRVEAFDSNKSNTWFKRTMTSSWKVHPTDKSRIVIVIHGSEHVFRLEEGPQDDDTYCAILEEPARFPRPVMTRWTEADFELLICHAVNDSLRMTVVLPFDATFADAKRAAAKSLGSEEILQRGRLVRPKGQATGLYLACKEASHVGQVRQVFLLGVDLPARASPSKT